jgi:tetratricopeptide (TPR) repeat protein
LKKAIDYSKKALNIAHERGDTGYEAIMLNNLGVVFVEEKRYKEALACYLLAKDIRLQIEDPILRVTESNLKDLEVKLGRREFEILASEVAPRAVEIVRKILD